MGPNDATNLLHPRRHGMPPLVAANDGTVISGAPTVSATSASTWRPSSKDQPGNLVCLVPCEADTDCPWPQLCNGVNVVVTAGALGTCVDDI